MNAENKRKLAEELGLNKKQIHAWIDHRKRRGQPKKLW